jgi:hypothetical protein
MTGITTYLSILTLNIADSASPSKHHLQIGLKDPTICCLQETHLIGTKKHINTGLG